MNARRLLAPLLAAACALLYLPSVVGGEFLNYDDPYLVVHNQVVREARLAHIVDPSAPREALGSEYLPLRDLTYALDASLFAADVPRGAPLPHSAASGFRLGNLLLYALGCALCALFVQGLLGAERSPERDRVALLAALLFALHPAHAESVAWVSGRKDVLSAVFVFASLLVHLRARDGDRVGLYALSALLGALACLSKATATALPLLVLAVEVWNPARGGTQSWRRRLLRCLPTLAVGVAAALLAVWVGRRAGLSAGMSLPRLLGRLVFDGVLQRDAVVLRHYAVTGFFPFELRITHHDLLEAVHPRAGAGPWLVATLTCLIPLGAALLFLGRRRRARAALVWFVGGLLPTLNLIPHPQLIADRFLCLPVLAPCLALALAGVRLDRSRPELARGLAAALLLTWAGLTVHRGLEFKTSVALWEAQVRDEPRDGLAWRQLGEARLDLALRTRGPERQERLDAAAATLERSLEAFDASPLASPSHELAAAYLLAQAHEAAGRSAQSLRALLAAATRLQTLEDPRIQRSFAPKLGRALRDMALDLSGSDDPAVLRDAVRALHLAGEHQGRNQILGRLRALDPDAAAALEQELGL